jgi:putative ABC transport system ATP-binding protein
VIRLEKVDKVYWEGLPSEVRALQQVDLHVGRGEHVAILGPSGSGKSTLLHILGCLDLPTHGRYLLEGQDTSRYSDRELSRVRNRRIGFVFQAFHLLERETALENVMLPLVYARRGDARKAAGEALARVGLEARMHHFPGQLSGGEKQRVALARALAKDPALILADEPTGNLDSVSGGHVLDMLGEVHARGVTLIVITHDDEVAARAGRRVWIRDGRLLQEERIRPGHPEGSQPQAG